jgi:hypothetical protein
MIILNPTSGKGRMNVVLTSLKEKKEDEDIIVGPGKFIDTQQAFVSDTKINRSDELRMYVKQGILKLFASYEEMGKSDSTAKIVKEGEKEEEKIQIDSLEASWDMSNLEDIIKNPKSTPEMRNRAALRLIEITDSSPEANDELKNSARNPII